VRLVLGVKQLAGFFDGFRTSKNQYASRVKRIVEQGDDFALNGALQID